MALLPSHERVSKFRALWEQVLLPLVVPEHRVTHRCDKQSLSCVYPPSSLQQHEHSLDPSGVVLPGDDRTVAGHGKARLSSGEESTPRIERPAVREQLDARPRRCYQRRPKSQHEAWVYDHGYILHRGNAHVPLSMQVYQMWSGFPRYIRTRGAMHFFRGGNSHCFVKLSLSPIFVCALRGVRR